MWSSTLIALVLTLPSLSNGLPEPFSAPYGTCLSVKETWEPDVTITQWSTETVHVSCTDCQTEGEFYALALPTALSSTTALWSKAPGPSPTTTLVPVSHWSQDGSNADVLVPAYSVQMYYAPSGAGST